MLLVRKKKSVGRRIAALLLAGILWSGSAVYAAEADTGEIPVMEESGETESAVTENVETDSAANTEQRSVPETEDVFSEAFVTRHKAFICDVVEHLLQDAYSYSDERLVELVERECSVEIRKESVTVELEASPDRFTRGRTRDNSTEPGDAWDNSEMLLNVGNPDTDIQNISAAEVYVSDWEIPAGVTENRNADMNEYGIYDMEEYTHTLQTILHDSSMILYYSGEEAAEARMLLESFVSFRDNLSGSPRQQTLTNAYVMEILNQKAEKSPLNRILLFLLIILSAVVSVLYMRCQNMDKAYLAMRAKVKQLLRQQSVPFRSGRSAGYAEKEYFPDATEDYDTEERKEKEYVRSARRPADGPNAEVLETYLYEVENIFKNVLQKNNRQLSALYGEYEALYQKYQEAEMDLTDCALLVRKSNRRLESILNDFMQMLQSVQGRDARKSTHKAYDVALEEEVEQKIHSRTSDRQGDMEMQENEPGVQELIKPEEQQDSSISSEPSPLADGTPVQDISRDLSQDLSMEESHILHTAEQEILTDKPPAQENNVSAQVLSEAEPETPGQVSPVEEPEVSTSIQDLSVAKPGMFMQNLPVVKPEVSTQSLPVAKPEVSTQNLPVVKPGVSMQSLPVAKSEVPTQNLPVAKPGVSTQNLPVIKPGVSIQDSTVTEPEVAAQGLPVAEAELPVQDLPSAEKEAPVQEPPVQKQEQKALAEQKENKMDTVGSPVPYSSFYSNFPFHTFSGTLIMPNGNIKIDKSVNYLIFTEKSKDILEAYPTQQAALDPAIRRSLMPYFEFFGNGILDTALEQCCVIKRSRQGRLRIVKKGKIHLI